MLLRYAQEDTHYLLKIYDLVRKDLIARGNKDKNLLHSVIQRSKQVALKVIDIECLYLFLILYSFFGFSEMSKVFNNCCEMIYAGVYR